MNKTIPPRKGANLREEDTDRMFPASTTTGKILYKELSYKIIGLAMQVHKELGHGFLEKVYENAMMVMFRLTG